MKAEIALSFFDEIVAEHKRIDSEKRFLDIVNGLRNHRNQSQNPRWLYAKEALEALSEDLSSLDYYNFLDNELNKFWESNTAAFLGSSLSNKIRNTIVDSSDDFDLFYRSIDNLGDKHRNALNTLRLFISSMADLGINFFPAPQPPARLCVIYFPSGTLSDIGFVRRDIEKIEDLFSSLIRAINDDPNSFQITALSTSRLKTYLQLGGMLAAAFSATVSFTLDSYKSYLEIETQIHSLSKIDLEIETASYHGEIRNKIVSACAHKVYSELTEIGIPANKEELIASCKQAISMIDDGFEFSLSDTKSAIDGADEIDKVENFTIVNARKLVQLNLELKKIRAPVMMIEDQTASSDD